MAISGTGVATIVAGGVVVYAGFTDQSIPDALRSVLRGEIKPVGKPAVFEKSVQPGFADAPGTSGSGSALADAAQKYVGRPYDWAHNFDPPNGGGDCSGLVYRAYHDIGINAPRYNSYAIARWRRVKVATPAAGDLLWWLGHVAIAVSSTRMVEAPTFGVPVRVVPIRSGALVMRYVTPSTPAKGRVAI